MVGIKRVLALLVLLVWLAPATAQFDFAAAANAYAAGDYTTAIAIYESAIAAGVRDGGVFFNLATAYFAAGDAAHALLNYLRAAEFIPRDSDAQLQIARLRARREDDILQETDAMILIGTVTNSWLTYSELNGLTWGIWTSFFIVVAVFFQQKHWRQHLRLILGTGAGILCLCLVLLWSRWWVQTSTPAAIVMRPTVQVMNGAGENYLPLFRVFAAAEVRILETRADWLRVSLPDGHQGWLHVNDVKKVMLP